MAEGLIFVDKHGNQCAESDPDVAYQLAGRDADEFLKKQRAAERKAEADAAEEDADGAAAKAQRAPAENKMRQPAEDRGR